MAITVEKVLAGARVVSTLDSFPLFCGYLLMICLAGQWKRIASPLNLRPVLIVYNFTASAISAYLLCAFAYGLSLEKSSFDTVPSDRLRPLFHMYWLLKIFELLDTVFMILRHKQRQISFLHVYHHSSMLLLTDLSWKFYPCPGIVPYLALNSAVHVLLYLYYGLSALYPDNPPQWKKFMTQFQILQFFIDMVHATIGYMYHGYCIYGIFYGITMICLFSNFYYAAYIQKRKDKPQTNGVSNGCKNGSVKPNGKH